jgi:alkanesulfonate monooxygenase SsuD/methylene tetrahydromethanopterin reductase-like flavin-dependent oxidoreductase (luciferase family)
VKVQVEIDRWPGTDAAQVETRGVVGTEQEVLEMLEHWTRTYGPVRAVHFEGPKQAVERVKAILNEASR